LHVSHPEIEEFINARKHSGGDISRKILHGHHAVIVDDIFMQRVITKGTYELKSPSTKKVIKEVDAFDLWTKILLARMETGEPYLMFEDNVNNNRCESYVKNKLYVTTSNLCNEIYLTTTPKDYLNRSRTSVCCLSSLNLEHFDAFKKDHQFFLDVLMFLDNVLEEFVEQSHKLKKHRYIKDAVYSAHMERSVGLGVMGFHSHLQQKGIPFDSEEAMMWNEHIFQTIQKHTKEANIELAKVLGANPDCQRANLPYRFSNVTAIAPTASISLVANTSPSIDPYTSNIYVQKNKEGTSIMKNKNLLEILEQYPEYQANPDNIWSSISEHQGSVQHLSFLTQSHKKLFKTAFEIDAKYLIKMAGTRQKYIDQGQSLNLFLLPNVEKKYFNEIHLLAWKEGLKGLYYVRSLNIGKMLSRKTTIEENSSNIEENSIEEAIKVEKINWKKIVEDQISVSSADHFSAIYCDKNNSSDCLACQ
jgi:ribonucleoside-diphosphate reductase alpha chain